MSRYVGIEILAESLCNKCVAACEGVAVREGKDGLQCGLKEFIDSLPTVDAAPVKHGHWIYKWNPYFKQELPYCSVCEKASPSISETDYCSHCGAKMDEVTE